jgi:hypothetical protein
VSAFRTCKCLIESEVLALFIQAEPKERFAGFFKARFEFFLKGKPEFIRQITSAMVPVLLRALQLP